MGRGPLAEGRPGSGGKRLRRGWGRRFSPPGRHDDGRNGRGISRKSRFWGDPGPAGSRAAGERCPVINGKNDDFAPWSRWTEMGC
ncbi:hypothetical protein CRG98_009538 [Punica granatum]|uniref:Uncharacterized protein n=1 Tax=Punica granatum TaxID=22663 RepID=A0A2I0KNK8_PUNGR|nr:hypothetical protein CRG98_009538 [Punica granatum]